MTARRRASRGGDVGRLGRWGNPGRSQRTLARLLTVTPARGFAGNVCSCVPERAFVSCAHDLALRQPQLSLLLRAPDHGTWESASARVSDRESRHPQRPVENTPRAAFFFSPHHPPSIAM